MTYALKISTTNFESMLVG